MAQCTSATSNDVCLQTSTTLITPNVTFSLYYPTSAFDSTTPPTRLSMYEGPANVSTIGCSVTNSKIETFVVVSSVFIGQVDTTNVTVVPVTSASRNVFFQLADDRLFNCVISPAVYVDWANVTTTTVDSVPTPSEPANVFASSPGGGPGFLGTVVLTVVCIIIAMLVGLVLLGLLKMLKRKKACGAPTPRIIVTEEMVDSIVET